MILTNHHQFSFIIFLFGSHHSGTQLLLFARFAPDFSHLTDFFHGGGAIMVLLLRGYSSPRAKVLTRKFKPRSAQSSAGRRFRFRSDQRTDGRTVAVAPPFGLC